MKSSFRGWGALCVLFLAAGLGVASDAARARYSAKTHFNVGSVQAVYFTDTAGTDLTSTFAELNQLAGLTPALNAITGNDSSLGITGAASGGAVPITGGAAAAGANTGGAAGITGGAGGAGSTTTAGGVGGATNLTAGAGGAKSGTGAAAGGAGGTSSVVGGAGGATASSGSDAGGAGGTVAFTGGVGGAATAGTGNGGAGGSITLTPGLGGATTGGTAGAPGAIGLAGPLNGQIGASTAALGTNSGTAAVLPSATGNIYPTTAADDTVGVRVSSSDKVTSRILFIGNGVSNKILKVYAPTGGTINGAAGDAAFSSASGKGVIIICLSSGSNTWLAF
jgi:hypothetical protein